MSANEPDQPATPPRSAGWGQSLRLGIILFLVYLANGRMIGAGDTQPSKLLPIAIIRGDGPYLDRFDPLVRDMNGLFYFVTEARGHIVSRYPLAPGLLSLIFDWPQVAILDVIQPNWEQESADAYITLIAKNTQALISAILGVMILQLLRNLGLRSVALPATLIATLGSSLWSIASQAPWQHGPAALALTASLLLLSGPEVGRTRLIFAGLAAGMLAAFRPIDVVLSVALFGWVLYRHRRGIVWFSIFPIVVAACLVGYNHWCFGDIRGGYADLQGKDGSTFAQCWDTRFSDGALGTLFSPNRGLFIFTPWIAVALLTLPMIAKNIRPHSLVRWMLLALIPYFVLLAKYRWWNAGWCFGPRYWTDVIPLFTVLLGFSLDWARQWCRPLLGVYVIAFTVSVVIHLIGVLYYPSSWDSWPENSDENRQRLWCWRDSELTRSLSEGVHPARFRPWSPAALQSAVSVPRPHPAKPTGLIGNWLEPSTAQPLQH